MAEATDLDLLPLLPSRPRFGASCEVRMNCGNIVGADTVRNVEMWGTMSVEEARQLFLKTLHCAQRAAYDIHEGDTVSVAISRESDV